MLNVFRKYATSWLIKVALFLIAIVFIFFTGYSYHSRQDTQMARIGDHYISIKDYDAAYDRLVELYRTQLGSNFSEEMIRQFNLKKQALNMLVERYIVVKAAQDLGLAATSEEIQKKILDIPAFVADGQFDRNRYVMLLRQHHLTPEAFEQQVLEEVTFGKVEAFIKRRAVVTEDDILAEFKYNQSLIQLAYIILEGKSFESQVAMDDAVLQAYYQEHQDRYKDPEKRQFSYVLLRTDEHLNDVVITEDEIRRYYDEHQADFHKEAEVKARHILFSVKEDAPEQEVAKARTEAEKVLQEAKKGSDFAELAKKYSKDPGSAKNGGDLGFFTQDRMTPAFSQAAFAMKPGDISDLVRTPFGFHIIKVEESHPEKTESLDEARSRIEQTMKKEKAREILFKEARDLADTAYAQKDIEKAAQARKLSVLSPDSWLAQKDSLPGVEGAPPTIMKKLFELSEKGTSEALDVPQGFVVAQLRAIQAPQVLPFDKVKDRLEKEYKTDQGRILAQQKAVEALDAARKTGNLEEAAKAKNLEVKKSDWFSRKDPDKELKIQGEAQNKVFQLEEAKPLPEAPLEMGNRYLVCQLLGKKTPTDTLDSERPTIVKRLYPQKESMIWQSWLDEQHKKTKVEVFREP